MSREDDIKMRLASMPDQVVACHEQNAPLPEHLQVFEPQFRRLLRHAPGDLAYLLDRVKDLEARIEAAPVVLDQDLQNVAEILSVERQALLDDRDRVVAELRRLAIAERGLGHFSELGDSTPVSNALDGAADLVERGGR